MTKNKKGKVLQMLSPEEFIRKQARTLPIYECWVNSDWQETQAAHILLARKHKNGNITASLYLTDLLCLGIKDTHYLYNIPETKYREQIYNISEQIEHEQCNYELVHNIIYTALKFAGKFGFKPQKDFTSVTQYMLEEDTDDIKPIAIECGDNGIPVYLRGPYESTADVNKIIKQLEKTAGQGNFLFIDDSEEDLEEDWNEDMIEEDLDFKTKYDALSITEKLMLFKNQMDRIEKLSKDEKIDFGDLMESIIGNYFNQKIADDFYDFYWNNLNKIEVTDELPDEMMIPGLLSKKENSELKSDFIEVYDLVLNYSSLAKKKIKSLIKKFPDNPAICFLELTDLRLNDSSLYQSKVEEYVQKFPNYSLIKLLDEIRNCVISQNVKENIAIENIIETYFPNRKSLHRTEIFHVFLLMLIYSTRTKNIELLDALDFLMEEFNLKEQELELLEYFVTMGKFEFILSQLQKE